MKSLIRFVALAAVLTIAQGMGVHAAAPSSTNPTPAKATAPTDRTYPANLPLTLEVAADEEYQLGTMRSITITAHREGYYQPIVVLSPVDPFTDTNACARPMPQGIAGCAVNGDATIGTLHVNWEVPAAGTYRIVVAGKRGASDRVETIGAFELEAND